MKKSEQIKLWKKLYSSDQENLYKNFFVRLLFDFGHSYIAKQGRHKKGVILDVGSGMGYHLKFEKVSNDRKYICLDRDPSMLSKIKYKNVSTMIGTCSEISLKDKSVDVVIASHIFEHLPNLRSDLNEIDRVLKDDGLLIVVLPCDPGFLWRILTFMTPSRWRLKKHGIDYDLVMKHEHVNTFSKCRKILRQKFVTTNETFFPFFIQNHNLNVLAGMTFTKK